jgi:hypothetical protein
MVGTTTAVGFHVAGEATKTGATLMGGALRIAVTIKEALASVYNAAAGAMSAMASIPYVGPFLAIAAMAAIIGVGIGLVGKIGKGFAQGGYTGPGAVSEVAGDVHKGEVVFSQQDIARHGGVSAVENLRVSGRGGYASLSPVAAAGSSASSPAQSNRTSPAVHQAFFNTQQDASNWLRSRSGRRVMTDFVNQTTTEA